MSHEIGISHFTDNIHETETVYIGKLSCAV